MARDTLTKTRYTSPIDLLTQTPKNHQNLMTTLQKRNQKIARFLHYRKLMEMFMRTGKKETLHAFTERALVATSSTIPPMVYIPANLRMKNMRINTDDAVTINPADTKENELRIAQADPTGFLIAIMQGQPIPSFKITRDAKGLRIEVDFEVAPVELRTKVAQELENRITKKFAVKPGDDGYTAMIAKAAQ